MLKSTFTLPPCARSSPSTLLNSLTKHKSSPQALSSTDLLPFASARVSIPIPCIAVEKCLRQCFLTFVSTNSIQRKAKRNKTRKKRTELVHKSFYSWKRLCWEAEIAFSSERRTKNVDENQFSSSALLAHVKRQLTIICVIWKEFEASRRWGGETIKSFFFLLSTNNGEFVSKMNESGENRSRWTTVMEWRQFLGWKLVCLGKGTVQVGRIQMTFRHCFFRTSVLFAGFIELCSWMELI